MLMHDGLQLAYTYIHCDLYAADEGLRAETSCIQLLNNLLRIAHKLFAYIHTRHIGIAWPSWSSCCGGAGAGLAGFPACNIYIDLAVGLTGEMPSDSFFLASIIFAADLSKKSADFFISINCTMRRTRGSRNGKDTEAYKGRVRPHNFQCSNYLTTKRI